MKIVTLAGLLLLLGSGIVFSQDKFFRKNGDILHVKIFEIGLEVIKYHQPTKGEDILFTIDKDKIQKVVFPNGIRERYMDNLRNPELFADQAQQALKLNFLSPLLGFTQITYEKLLKPGQSYELALGLIGLGKDQTIMDWDAKNFKRHARGLFFEGGMKFIKLHNFRTSET